MGFTAEFFKDTVLDLYHRFTANAKVPEAFMQVRLRDGRDFWVNEIAYGEQEVSFYQRVSKEYLVMFVVPYEMVAYMVFHSDVPPEYRAPEKRPMGFRPPD